MNKGSQVPDDVEELLHWCQSTTQCPPQSGISTKRLECSIVHDWCPSLAMMGPQHGEQDVIRAYNSRHL